MSLLLLGWKISISWKVIEHIFVSAGWKVEGHCQLMIYKIQPAQLMKKHKSIKDAHVIPSDIPETSREQNGFRPLNLLQKQQISFSEFVRLDKSVIHPVNPSDIGKYISIRTLIFFLMCLKYWTIFWCLCIAVLLSFACLPEHVFSAVKSGQNSLLQ